MVGKPVKDAGPSWEAQRKVVNSADMSTATNITDAPDASTYKQVLTDVVISAGAAMTVTLKEETSGTVFGGPYYLAANSTVQITPRGKWKLATANKRWQAQASATGNVTVETFWYEEP